MLVYRSRLENSFEMKSEHLESNYKCV